MRLNLGFGGVWVRSRFDSGDVRFAGGAADFDVLVGGTPVPGLAVGGGLMLLFGGPPAYGVDAPDPGGERRDFAQSQEGIGLALLGPMIDGFPNPRGGFHVGGLVGFASVGITDGEDNASGGFGVSLWTGYDWWVGKQWSVGVLARLSGARTTLELPELGDSADLTGAAAVLATALFH